jgi:uncharacterized membrane protein YgdD (TMEM256/DUF423 family)
MTVAHGSLQAFLAVLLGAFGAHGLQQRLDEYHLKVWQTGVTYHLTHALALVLLGVIEKQNASRLRTTHALFGAGILLFSGSLYALALTGNKALGMITPLGGAAFLAGWLALAWSQRR